MPAKLSDSKNAGSGVGDQGHTRVVSDTPASNSDHDALNFLPYAQALAFLIDRKDTSSPLIIAISAPWGAGKTTLAKLVQQELQAPGDWDEPHVICPFNAWNHDDAPHLGAAFAADVAQHANQYRPWWRRIMQPLPSVMLTHEQAWRRRLYVVLFALAAAVLLIFTPGLGKIMTAAAQPTSVHWRAAEHAAHGWGLTTVFFLAVLSFIYPRVLSGVQAVARFIKDPQAEAAHGSMTSVRTQLGRLIRQATCGRRRFVIFVDDLERCRPPRAVEVCEVASQLLNHQDTVTVIVADMDAIAMSAAIKYRALELPDSAMSASEQIRAAYLQYGRAYLQKLVQIHFDLPPATREQLKRMLVGDAGSSTGSLSSRLAPSKTVNARGRQMRTWAWAAGAFVSTFALFGGSVLAAGNGRGAEASNVSYGLIGAITISAGVAACCGAFSAWRARRRARVLRSQIDKSLQEQSAGTTVEEAVENISMSDQKAGTVSVEKRYFRAVMEPAVVSRADDLVFEFLPTRPRAAKRLLNQVRLMISIAIARGLFVLPGESTEGRAEERQNNLADRVGKWLVLRERWPDVAEAAEHDPKLMENLETAGEDTEKLRPILDARHISGVEDLDDLGKLVNKKPKFGDLSGLVLLSGASPATGDRY